MVLGCFTNGKIGNRATAESKCQKLCDVSCKLCEFFGNFVVHFGWQSTLMIEIVGNVFSR